MTVASSLTNGLFFINKKKISFFFSNDVLNDFSVVTVEFFSSWSNAFSSVYVCD